ncbi:hypothetical protein BYT27DRAFT_7339271 [Phlegmacium glaucopus]|nr:hypothetical protein BYT27DRAFT_7339271 [Phlegmacium glaucopus]
MRGAVSSSVIMRAMRGVVSFFKQLLRGTPDAYTGNPTNADTVERSFGSKPDAYNPTNADIERYHEIARQARAVKDKAEAYAADAKKRAADSAQLEAAAIKREKEALRKKPKPRKHQTGTRESGQEAKAAAELARYRIQPEVWPTEEEFQFARDRIQYDPEKLHFAVCGGSGSGKSSLVNAFCGLKNNSSQAARVGVVETTKAIARYPDPRQEIPYNRLVWFDCSGAGTPKMPGWQYFNEQGLFIFDIVILVYDTRFTEIDISIIRNCERFNIPLFIVRSKSDTHIRNILQDLGYDDNDAEVNREEFEGKARQFLINTTRNNVETNLKEAGLAMHDIFIVSSSVIYSLVTNNGNKKKTTSAIDEARLIDTVLKTAYARRYGTQAPAKDHSSIIEGSMVTDSSQLVLST